MDNRLFRLAPTLLVAASALASTSALPIPGETPSAAEERKIIISPKDSPEEVRRKLREAGVPEEKIEEILAKTRTAVAKRVGASSGATAAGSSSTASAGFASPGASVGASSTASATAAPVAPRQPEINTAQLDAQAMESKDPALEADRKAIESLRQEKSFLEAKIAFSETKRRHDLFPITEERAKIEADRALLSTRASAKAVESEALKARLERELAVATAAAAASLAEKSNRLKDLEAESRLLRAKADADLAEPTNRLALVLTKVESARYVEVKKDYPLDPLKDGVLKISDRRVPFNGPVTEELADFVTERIAYYNNADSVKPIFIVIDASPGGSVMAGYRILNAMKSSKAPVYVVVKQFAASMAAITTTMADRSFVYPGTIILHHQMSTGFKGNMRTLAESYRFTNDLFERIFTPVYTKIGYKTSKEFVDDMYRNFRSGDWMVFGNEAVSRKWATDLVTRIEETSVSENTASDVVGSAPMVGFASGCTAKQDAEGRTRFVLPSLISPGDAWVIHDLQGVFITK